jgi:dienelactone hydrolase
MLALQPTPSPRSEPLPAPLVRPRRVRGPLVVRAALALVALHVADDAFIHPEPGTAAADHIASGLIPVALLAALALAHPRLPAWWQSVLTGTVALTALVASIGVSARHAAIAGIGGDDVSGIVAGLAAVALLGCALLAAPRAWRAGSACGSRAWRSCRRALLALALCAAGLFVVAPVTLSILATHKARAPVEAADLGRPYERVSLHTSDGLTLRGWYVPSRTRAAIIASPGRTGLLDHARMLVRHGYGVLLFDRRGEGESEGDFNAFGWDGEADLEAAVAFLARRPDVDRRRIGGIGLSVGGELLLQAAAHQPLLRAVVSDGAGVRSIRDHLATYGGPFAWITPLLAETAATAVLSDGSPPPPLGHLVDDIAPRAAFFIHAGKGHGGEELNPQYHAAARPPKQLWQIPEAGHTGGLDARPAEYERRVVAFFERHLPARRRGRR